MLTSEQEYALETATIRAAAPENTDMDDHSPNSAFDDANYPPAFAAWIAARGVTLEAFQAWDFDLRDDVISAWNAYAQEQADAE